MADSIAERAPEQDISLDALLAEVRAIRKTLDEIKAALATEPSAKTDVSPESMAVVLAVDAVQPPVLAASAPLPHDKDAKRRKGGKKR